MTALTLKRSTSRSSTGWLLLMEKPKSPLNTARIHIRYWVANE